MVAPGRLATAGVDHRDGWTEESQITISFCKLKPNSDAPYISVMKNSDGIPSPVFHTSSLRSRGMGTMPPLRREPARPKAASVPQAIICMPLPDDAQLTCAGPSLQAAVTAPPTPQHHGQILNPKECGIHDDAPIHWPSKYLRRQVRESSSQQRETPASADPAGWS